MRKESKVCKEQHMKEGKKEKMRAKVRAKEL